MFSSLVWHERLLYGEFNENAVNTLAEKFSLMGTGLRDWWGGKKN
jgi:hypothetical protein